MSLSLKRLLPSLDDNHHHVTIIEEARGFCHTQATTIETQVAVGVCLSTYPFSALNSIHLSSPIIFRVKQQPHY
jgi:hypothetical protein